MRAVSRALDELVRAGQRCVSQYHPRSCGEDGCQHSRQNVAPVSVFEIEFYNSQICLFRVSL